MTTCILCGSKEEVGTTAISEYGIIEICLECYISKSEKEAIEIIKNKN